MDTVLAVGKRVRVVASVYARTDTLGLGPKVLRVTGEKGTITGGPAGSSTAWGLSWFVHYDVAPDGWSTAKYLALDSVVVPPPPPPPSVPVAVVSISPLSMTLELLTFGAQAIATAKDSTGAVLARPITWTSQDPTVATVDAAGMILPQHIGTTVIVATSGGKSAALPVTVIPARPTPPTVAGLFCSTLAKFAVQCRAGTYGPWPAYADSTGAVAGHFIITFTVP